MNERLRATAQVPKAIGDKILVQHGKGCWLAQVIQRLDDSVQPSAAEQGDVDLLQTTDAVIWAREFSRIARAKGYAVDEEWMVTWFANAIITGQDHAMRDVATERQRTFEQAARANCYCCRAPWDWHPVNEAGFHNHIRGQIDSSPCKSLEIWRLSGKFQPKAGPATEQGGKKP